MPLARANHKRSCLDPAKCFGLKKQKQQQDLARFLKPNDESGESLEESLDE